MSIEQKTGQGEYDDVTLTLGDRINFPFILAQQIIAVKKAFVKEEGLQSQQEMNESVQVLYAMVPDAWRISEPEFQAEVQKAITYVKVDNRSYWCGIPVGPLTFNLVKRYDPIQLFHAIMNLFFKKGLLSRTMYEEIATGKDYVPEPDTDIEGVEEP